MFRPMRRFKQQLTEADCFAVLQTAKRGVLAVHGDDGYPYAVPLNFVFDPDARTLYFHMAVEGHKLDAIRRDSKVCFTVMATAIKLRATGRGTSKAWSCSAKRKSLQTTRHETNGCAPWPPSIFRPKRMWKRTWPATPRARWWLPFGLST